MVENRPLQNVLTHATLILGIVIVSFPIYIAFVASTHKGYLLFRIINIDGFVKSHLNKLQPQTVRDTVQRINRLKWQQYFFSFLRDNQYY